MNISVPKAASTDPLVSHVPITQAGVIALVTVVVGLVVSFVPSLAGEKQLLITAATTLVATGWLIANAIHANASAKQLTALAALQPTPAPVPPAAKTVAS